MIPLIQNIWDSQIQRDTKVSGGCQGLGERGKASKYLMIQNFSLGKQNCAEDGWWCYLHSDVNIFNSLELYSLKWLNGIFCYVYFTKIKV